MNKSYKTYTILFLSFLIILPSCGGGNSKSINSFNTNAILSQVHPITNDERNIATRICYAYQSKSKNFRGSDYLSTQFIFSTQKNNCQNTTTTGQVLTTLNYDISYELSYIPQNILEINTELMKKVQTDSSGYLIQLCSKIKNNEIISNTVDQAGIKIQINFLRENLDGYLLQYFTLQPDNSYKITSAEKFKVRTVIDYTKGQILGMDEYYMSNKLCSPNDKISFSTFEQNFISR